MVTVGQYPAREHGTAPARSAAAKAPTTRGHAAAELAGSRRTSTAFLTCSGRAAAVGDGLSRSDSIVATFPSTAAARFVVSPKLSLRLWAYAYCGSGSRPVPGSVLDHGQHSAASPGSPWSRASPPRAASHGPAGASLMIVVAVDSTLETGHFLCALPMRRRTTWAISITSSSRIRQSNRLDESGFSKRTRDQAIADISEHLPKTRGPLAVDRKAFALSVHRSCTSSSGPVSRQRVHIGRQQKNVTLAHRSRITNWQRCHDATS